MALSSAALLASCAGPQSTYRMEFEQDVSLVLNDESTREVKRGEVVELPAEPVMVARADHRSMLLVPVPADAGTLRLKLLKNPTENAGATPEISAGTIREATKIVREVVEIQTLMAANRPDEALARIQTLKATYPGFSYARFIEASCHLLKQDYDRAKELVMAALEDFPDDPAGKALAAQIGVSVASPDAAEAH